MKTTKQLIGIIILTFGVLFHVQAQSWITNGLVAFYPFIGNPNDAVGSNHGTVNGAVLTTNRFGSANSAYQFNGTSSSIDFASPPLTQVANWTLSAWINPANLTQTGFAVEMGFDNGVSGNGYGMGVEGSSRGPGEGSLLALFSGVSFLNTGQPLTNANRWSHIVMLRDATTTKFFLNGIQAANTYTISPNAPSDFTIGSQNNTRFFNGLIDDVRIYGRALSPSEVLQLYNIEAANVCTPHKATAIASITNGFVVAASLTDTGCGYTNTPLVTIEGGGGSGATALAIMQNGRVIAINMTDAGCCYTNAPKIIIAPPPSIPTISISVSKVKVTQGVTAGRNYILESSFDLTAWTPTGPSFTAQEEIIVNEFDVDETGRFFRIREVQ